MLLTIITLIATIYIGSNILAKIPSIITKIIAGIGLFVGLGNICSLVIIGIIVLNNCSKPKLKNKNKRKYISLTKEINKKNKELLEKEKETMEITSEINKIVSDIELHQTLIEEAIKELKIIREKLESLVVENQTKAITDSFEEKIIKPYTRVKKTCKNN